MIHRISIVLLFVTALLLLSTAPASADGCLVMSPSLPPLQSGKYIEPAQNCFVVDVGDGTEALVLQVSFGKTDLSEFGWLIPLPAVPEVREESEAVFNALWDVTTPRQTYSTGGGCSGGSGQIIEPPMPLAGEDSASKINMIEKQTVGEYDIFTISAETPEELKTWIDDNGFETPEGYQSIFQNYINKGWIFVAIKVHLPEEIPWYVYEGNTYGDMFPIYYSILQPLFFQFKTDQLVYPMLISKLNGGSTDLTMWVLADHRMQFKDGVQKWAGKVKQSEFPDYHPLEFYVRGDRYLTRLRRVYFWDSDYDADLYLTQAPSDVEDRHGAVEIPAHFVFLGFLAAGLPLYGNFKRLRRRASG